MLEKNEILKIAENIKNCTVGIIGDFCADIYWHADMTKSELSRETPHYPLPVTEERTYLGAGGNVAANMAALNPGRIYAMSLIGDDWRGMLLEDLLKKNNISSEFFIKVPGRFTNAYCKPMRHGISSVVYEDPRLDFDNYSPVDEETEKKIIENLYKMAEETDVICVADQFRYGIITPEVREAIINLAKNGHTVIADSRYNIEKYTDCILKPNEVECWRAVYHDEEYLNADDSDFIDAAVKLAFRNNAKVFCTLGDKGSFVTDGRTGHRIKAVPVSGELDICGAGDTSLSAFTCALSGGTDIRDAAAFAGMASAVTVQKIGITGTASIDEILKSAE